MQITHFFKKIRASWRYGLIFSLLVVWGPLYRALLDKCWVLSGDISSVAHWAQWQTSADLIAVPVGTGVAMGLTVFTAQRGVRMHIPFLLTSYLLGLLYTLPLLIITWVYANEIVQWLGLQAQPIAWFRLAILNGWLATAVGQICSFYLGRRQHARVMLALVVTGSPVVLAVAIGIRLGWDNLPLLALLTMLLMSLLAHVYLWLKFWHWQQHTKDARSFFNIALAKLTPYIAAGFSVGLLTPLSVLVVRSVIAHDLNWHAAGVSTALWRTSDWVLSTSQGVMYYHFLPILSQQIKRGHGIAAMLRINAKVFLPSILVLFLLFIARDSVLPLLYDQRLKVDWQVAALFWSGDALRVLACIYLMGLYSMHATRAITVWDIFSQPLLALILMLGASQSMMNIGYAHFFTYFVYTLLCISSYFYLAERVRNKTRSVKPTRNQF